MYRSISVVAINPSIVYRSLHEHIRLVQQSKYDLVLCFVRYSYYVQEKCSKSSNKKGEVKYALVLRVCLNEVTYFDLTIKLGKLCQAFAGMLVRTSGLRILNSEENNVDYTVVYGGIRWYRPNNIIITTWSPCSYRLMSL